MSTGNLPPVLQQPVPNQNATEDVAFSYTFPGSTFTDPDVGSTLSWMATRAEGGALPAWLYFDAATRTFSGTPANADVGVITVQLQADDGEGGTARTQFDIWVANSNDVPTRLHPLADQSATENGLFHYTMPVHSFADIDAGDMLTYSAHMAGGGALPGWLTFDAATHTFSGTPSNADVGTLSIDVIASDGNGSSVSDTFTLVVQASPLGGSVVETTGPSSDTQVITAGAPFFQSFVHDSAGSTYTIDQLLLQLVKDPYAAAQTLTLTLLAGAHNGSIVKSATLSSADIGTTLAWQAFDVSNTMLSDGQLYFLRIESSDNDGLIRAAIHNTNVYANGSYYSSAGVPDTGRDLAFQLRSGNNLDPVLAQPVPAQNATEDTAFNFQFSASTFSDANGGDTLSYTAALAEGGELPAWLSFNAATRTFSGTPSNADVGAISIMLSADDGHSGTPARHTFHLTVANSNDAPNVAHPLPDQSATEDFLFHFRFAAQAFADVDVGNTFSYTAQLAGGGCVACMAEF